MTIETKAITTAPYASVKPFSEILHRVRQLQLKIIDSETLKKWGYKHYDASSAISALKFLNLIDGNANTTSDYVAIKSDIKYQSELRRIVEGAYDRLFAIFNNDFSAASKKDIVDTIILEEAYPKTSKQSAGKAAGLFVWLCNEAGIEISEKQAAETAKAPIKNSKSINKIQPRSHPSSLAAGERGFINLTVSLDPNMTEDDIYQILTRVRSAMERFNDDASKQ